MIALLLTDIHGRMHVLEKILAAAGNFDLVIFSGDITELGGDSQKAIELIDILKKTGKPVLAVPGNCDPKEVRDSLEASGMSIHNKRKLIGGFVFAGFGGSNPTPFDTPFEMPDAEVAAGLSSVLLGLAGRAENLALVTHAPPKDTPFDRLPNGAHAGSDAVRNAVETHQPALLFCGHIHEGAGSQFVGKTLVINPGPALAGHWATVDLKTKKAILRSLGTTE